MSTLYFLLFFSCCFCKLDEKKIVFSKGLNVGTKDKPFYLEKNCKFESEKEFELKKFSEVKKNKNLSSRNLLTRAPVVVSSTPHTLTDNINLSATDTLEFDNASPGSDKDMVVNGDGHFLSFPAGSSTQGLILDENVDLTVNDTVLKNYNPAAISFAGAGGTLATISFGDDCIVELGADQTIADADAAWTFTGDATLNGFGNTLRIEKASGLTVADAKTVTLKNIKIVTTVVDGLKCLGNDSHLKLQDCEFVLQDAGFDFDTGHLDIAGIVVLEGANLSDQNRTEFLFSTGGNLTIGENAILKVEPYVNFKYDADPVLNGDDAEEAKRHIVFEYISSVLHLNGCGIESAENGVALEEGTIVFENEVDIVSSTTAGAEFELWKTSNNILLADARLKVAGPIIYNEIRLLKYGSSFTLKNQTQNVYLSSPAAYERFAAYPSEAYARFMGGDALVLSNDTKLLAEKSTDNTFTFTTQGNVLSEDLLRISFWAFDGAPLFYILFGDTDPAPVSTPTLPNFFAYAYNQFKGTSSSDNLKIIKNGGMVGDTIEEGDVVILTYQGSTSFLQNGYFIMTTQNVSGNSGGGPLKEVVLYQTASGGGTAPGDSSHLWVVENIVENDYANNPNYP